MTRNHSLKILLLLALWGFARLLHGNTLLLNDIYWPPYLFPESDKNFSGLGKDILNECLQGKGFTIQYNKLPIKRTKLYMQNGELDVSLYSYKKDREDFLVYGKVPIYTSEYGFAVRSDSDIEIQKIADLQPFRVGHLAGLSHTPEILAIIEQKRLKDELAIGHSIDAMFGQLLSLTPRFEIMPNSKQTFFWQAKRLGVSDKIRVLDYTAAQKDYFVTVSKNSQNISDISGFLDDVDTCILNMHLNGRYNVLLKKYSLDGLVK